MFSKDCNLSVLYQFHLSSYVWLGEEGGSFNLDFILGHKTKHNSEKIGYLKLKA